MWPVHLSAVVSVLLTYKDLVVEQSGRTTGGWEEQSDNIYEIANLPMKLKFELWVCFSFATLYTKKAYLVKQCQILQQRLHPRMLRLTLGRGLESQWPVACNKK